MQTPARGRREVVGSQCIPCGRNRLHDVGCRGIWDGSQQAVEHFENWQVGLFPGETLGATSPADHRALGAAWQIGEERLDHACLTDSCFADYIEDEPTAFFHALVSTPDAVTLGVAANVGLHWRSRGKRADKRVYSRAFTDEVLELDLQLHHGSEAIGWFLCEALVNDLLHPGRYWKRRGIIAQESCENCCSRIALKRSFAGKHLVEHCTKTEYVRSGIDLVPLRLFRGHVCESAHDIALAGHCCV